MVDAKGVKNRKRRAIVLGSILILVALGIVCYFIFRKKQVTIPDVIGMSYEDAVSTISAELCKIGVRDADFHKGWVDASNYAFVVASQDPKAGTTIKRGEEVSVYLYVGEAWGTTNAASGEENTPPKNCYLYNVAGILLIWILCFLSVLLHELGHALGYRIGGGEAEWKIRAGSGPKIRSAVKFIFCLLPVGGYFDPCAKLRTKKEKLAMLAGGPLVTLLLAAMFYVFSDSLAWIMNSESVLYGILFPVCLFLMFYNLFLFLFSAVPMRYKVVCKGLESDGLQIVRALKHKE
ncbi:MAG: PASTA domain-containing protein [Paludibacteraceae bacterium]|nr:PASTA domain-containing protein [Paludibacteraceae bacterium]